MWCLGESKGGPDRPRKRSSYTGAVTTMKNTTWTEQLQHRHADAHEVEQLEGQGSDIHWKHGHGRHEGPVEDPGQQQHNRGQPLEPPPRGAR